MVDAETFFDTIGAAPGDTMSDLIGVLFHHPFGAPGTAGVEWQHFGAPC